MSRRSFAVAGVVVTAVLLAWVLFVLLPRHYGPRAASAGTPAVPPSPPEAAAGGRNALVGHAVEVVGDGLVIEPHRRQAHVLLRNRQVLDVPQRERGARAQVPRISYTASTSSDSQRDRSSSHGAFERDQEDGGIGRTSADSRTVMDSTRDST